MPRNATTRSSSKSTQKRAAPKGASQDVLRMLMDDHKKVKKMFDEFEKIKDKADDEQKQLLVETACAELTIHAQLEEELFYPAARDAIEEMDLLDEAEVEHASAKQLISELSAMQPGDDLYDAKFTVLGEYVKHHIEEEEKQLFPLIKKSELDMAEMAEDMQERKAALREELGFMSADEAEEDEESDAAAAPASRKNVH